MISNLPDLVKTKIDNAYTKNEDVKNLKLNEWQKKKKDEVTFTLYFYILQMKLYLLSFS